MKSASVRLRAAIVAVAVAATAPACADAQDLDRTQSSPSPTATTTSSASAAPKPPPITRPSCEVALPAAWQELIEGSGVDTGGVSTMPLAVGPAGEVVAQRDNGETRDLVLIGADKSVTEIYAVADPNRYTVGFAAIDDRWIVVGVYHHPRNANGVLPTLTRIDVVDRQSGAVRTVAQEPVEARPTLDSVALFRGKVYWITRATYADETGTVSSYDLATGAVADVGLGAGRDIRATAAGLTWVVEDTRREVKIPDSLPTPIADEPGIDRDRVTLATDGTSYAWITGVDQGGTGVAWWSPESGLVRIPGEVVQVTTWTPPVYVVGPYVVIGKSGGDDRSGADTLATVVDTRSGAVTHLHDRVSAAAGGTIAMGMGEFGSSIASVVRADALPPLTC